MNTFWSFPAATGGMINSIHNAGLETFRGNALDSLTREICQNSLDAVKDKDKRKERPLELIWHNVPIVMNRRKVST